MKKNKLSEKIRVYVCLITMVISVVTPSINALARPLPDYDFYSSNDVLFYDPCEGDGSDEGGAGGGSCNAFDTSKLAKYEQEGSGDGGRHSSYNGPWAKTQEARDYAVNDLGVDASGIKIYDKDEVKKMIMSETARQFEALPDKFGSTLAEAQTAMIYYQTHESAEFQQFKEEGGALVPSYTNAGDEYCTDIFSLTDDKFNNNKGKSMRATASYDIRYAIYLGVKENMQAFQGTQKGASSSGLERWKWSIGKVFWPGDDTGSNNYYGNPINTWEDMTIYKMGNMSESIETVKTAWEEIATYVSDHPVDCSGDTGGSSTLDGYTLPATSGKTGYEQAMDAEGALVDANGNRTRNSKGNFEFVSFHSLASTLSPEYRQYYITMRWNWTSWYWHLTNDSYNTGLDSAQYNWMAQKPRMILVTNTRTNQSVYVAALESGSAPWTGVAGGQDGSSATENGWSETEAIKGTPAEYKGRVSGLSPDAIRKIGAQQGEYSNGQYVGDTLNYQWATNQDVTPGPTTDIASGGDNDTDASSSAGGQTVIAIDPGHTGPGDSVYEMVPNTTLNTQDYNNTPETEDVYKVAEKLKIKLEEAGYKVVMTKNGADDRAGLVTKANIVNDSQADLALSIHYNGDDWGSIGSRGEIYPQRVGKFRGNERGTEGSDKLTFNDAAVAQKSEEYAEKFKTARESNGESNITIKDLDLGNRALIPGDITFVQLLSKSPWVYNEAGSVHEDSQQETYATGLFEGIKSSIGPNEHQGGGSGGDSDGCNDSGSSGSGVVQGNIVKTAVNWSWPELTREGKYRKEDAKPEYVEAVKQYAGSYANDPNAYTYCNVFVLTVMRAAADPDYPLEASGGQMNYMGTNSDGKGSDKYTEINVTEESDLEPGDILVDNGHVYFYAGDQGHPNYKAISASGLMGEQSRVPMASNLYGVPGRFSVYRYKG